MPIRVLDANGRGNTFVLAYAIEYAVANGADIINLSLGADCDSDVLKEAIDAALANNVLVVAAAGNDGSNVPQCPAKYFGVIGVTAVRSDNSVPEWANYGDWVQLAAPGEGITSTIVGPEGAGYASWSGTSMATPFVTGAAALVKQKYPAYKVTGLFSALVEQFTNISSATGGRVERLLNIAAALGSTGPAAPVYTVYLPTVGK
jgi:subtilisin family serine protease